MSNPSFNLSSSIHLNRKVQPSSYWTCITAILFMVALSLGACSDNSSGPEKIPTGTSNFGYQTMSGQPTISGSFELSGIDLCQDVDPSQAGNSYFEGLDAACVMAWKENGNIHIATADPGQDNRFDVLTYYFPEVSSPAEVQLGGCGDSNDCSMFYGENVYNTDSGILEGDQRLFGTDFSLEITEINDSRIKGQFIGDGVLIQSDGNREIAVTGNFDIPFYSE